MKILGKRVVDAKQDAALDITGDDVKRAKPMDQHNCAAALACKRAFKATDVRVQMGTTYILNGGRIWKRYLTPQSLRAEIIAIDRGGRFEPGMHVLKAPKGDRRLGQRVKPSGPRKTSGEPPRQPKHFIANVRSGTPRTA